MGMVYVETWDEDNPAGSRARSLGDDDIRELKRAFRERLAADHDFRADESGIDTIGYHKAVHLLIEASDPTAEADMGILYTKDVSGKAELHFIDEDSNAIQITSAGQFHSRINNPLGLIAMWYGTIASIPSGWVLCNGSNSTPDLRDKFIVGARQDDNAIAKTNITGSLTASGGAITHSHDAGSLAGPSHTHSVSKDGWGASGMAVSGRLNTTGGASEHTLYNAANDLTSGAGGTGAITGTSATATDIPPYYALAFIMKN